MGAENKQITEMLPGILNQLGAESLTHLKRLASNVGGAGVGGAMEAANNMDEEDDDEVPDLVENFDEVSKNEAATASEPAAEAEAAPAPAEAEVESEPAPAPAEAAEAAAPEEPKIAEIPAEEPAAAG